MISLAFTVYGKFRIMSEAAPLTNEETEFIYEARRFLEKPSLLIRIANKVGKPLDRGLRALPVTVQNKIHLAVEKSLKKGLDVVTKSLPEGDSISFSDAVSKSRRAGALHSLASFGTGAVGGFFGVAGLPIELPVTTGIMLRAIASIARDFGFDPEDPEIQLECLSILAIGGESAAHEADAVDSAYWTSRLAFSDLIRQAAREMRRGASPILVRLLARIAARFEFVVSEKVLAEIVPVVGAIGGGAINAAFTEHFTQAARYHFGLRAMGRTHGDATIKQVYEHS